MTSIAVSQIVQMGTTRWNATRPNAVVLRKEDLRGVDLSGGYDLSGADFQHADLTGAVLACSNLTQANLYQTLLVDADLRSAHLGEAELGRADLTRADLRDAELDGANLGEAVLSSADLTRVSLNEGRLLATDLSNANLTGATLDFSVLVRTVVEGAQLRGARVFGVSVWELIGTPADQRDLIITAPDANAVVTVDNLKVAQFIHLISNNPEIRDVIDTVSKKVVLILGRFSPARKTVLDTVRDGLRAHGYVPVVFDFEPPHSRDLTETVRTLAHLARFVVADVTDPSSVPHELQAIVPDLNVAVQPIIQAGNRPYAMFHDLVKYHWLLPIHEYSDCKTLLDQIEELIIKPAERMVHSARRSSE